jgi:hypothetical protein
MRLTLLLGITILLGTFLFSCSKDKDGEKPKIVINSPFHLQQVNGIDTIQVLATISDDRNIESVTVSVRNENDINVLANVSKKPNTKNYNLNISYFFDNLQLEQGVYNLSVRVFDGENTTSEYVKLYYNETPQFREGVFVVSNSLSLTTFSLLNDNYTANFYNSVHGDHLKTVVDSYNQQLIHSSSQPGNLSTIDLSSNSPGWNVNFVPFPLYTGFYSANQNLYLGEKNGGIEGFDKNGNPNYHTPINTGLYTECMHIHNNQFLVSEERSASTNTARLVLYWMASGALYQQAILNEDVKGIFSKSTNTIILLGNNSSLNGKVLFYDVPSSFITSPFSINVGEIEDCFEIGNGTYLVAEGGNLTIIDINTFTTSSYLSNIGAKKMWYDEVTNELFVGNVNILSIYDFTTKNLKGTYTHSSEIKDVVFWYNK